jgi:hypothetical protein
MMGGFRPDADCNDYFGKYCNSLRFLWKIDSEIGEYVIGRYPMSFPQEGFARDVHRELIDQLASSPATRIEIAGIGIAWRCLARRGDRSCSVTCFHSEGPEYLIEFQDVFGPEAAGRTRSSREAAESAALWLDCERVEDLREQFAFVDRRKRKLWAIEAAAIARHPELDQVATHSLLHMSYDYYDLTFTLQDRDCWIALNSDEDTPVAVFSWDNCGMIRTRTGDAVRLSSMLGQWLLDSAMPSEMAREFPELEIMPEASHYEQGRPVEGEFLKSWDEIERYYENFALSWHPYYQCGPIVALIAEIRRAGFDRTLRAGQSLLSFCVSRSRRHGLRPDQPSVNFDFDLESDSMTVTCNGPSREKFSVPRIALEARVEWVLNRLALEPID